jgi:hypothetical protein
MQYHERSIKKSLFLGIRISLATIILYAGALENIDEVQGGPGCKSYFFTRFQAGNLALGCCCCEPRLGALLSFKAGLIWLIQALRYSACG